MEWVKMTGHSNDIDSESNQNMNFGQTWFSLMASPRQRGLIGSSGAFLKRSSELDERRKSVRSRSVSILLDEKIKLSEADPYWDFLDILLKFRSFTTQAQILYLVFHNEPWLVEVVPPTLLSKGRPRVTEVLFKRNSAVRGGRGVENPFRMECGSSSLNINHY